MLFSSISSVASFSSPQLFISAIIGLDTLRGGQGNDILTGGTGNDLFVWDIGDGGIERTPEVDHITDFEYADTLDFSGLLVGEDNATIGNYLSFGVDSGHLVMNVTTDGAGVADLDIHLDNYAMRWHYLLI